MHVVVIGATGNVGVRVVEALGQTPLMATDRIRALGWPTAHRHRRPARAAGRHPRSRRHSDRAAASSGCRPLNPKLVTGRLRATFGGARRRSVSPFEQSG